MISKDLGRRYPEEKAKKLAPLQDTDTGGLKQFTVREKNVAIRESQLEIPIDISFRNPSYRNFIDDFPNYRPPCIEEFSGFSIATIDYWRLIRLTAKVILESILSIYPLTRHTFEPLELTFLRASISLQTAGVSTRRTPTRQVPNNINAFF